MSGYAKILLTANRGPMGGMCTLETDTSDANNIKYDIECMGWTDEENELPVQYNFMILDSKYYINAFILKFLRVLQCGFVGVCVCVGFEIMT